jgi:hypothetical protein
MDAARPAPRLVRISGDSALVERLEQPLHRALDDREHVYVVGVDAISPTGEILVSINGPRGCLPLLFRARDVDDGNVFQVVKDTVARLDF